MDMHLDTEILYQGNAIPGIGGEADAPPVCPATAYAVQDTEDYCFAGRGGKYLYSRTANPNRDGLGQAVSYLEGGEATLVCSSGMAAIAVTLLGLAKAGDHIVMNRAVYGETIELVQTQLKSHGVQTTFVDFRDMAAVKAAIRDNTVLLYTEVITNPLTWVIDLPAVAAVARANGVLTVVDSTFTTPLLIRPLQCGADVVVHSLTKYFGGHSDLTGGSITGSGALMRQLRSTYLLLGCCLDPYSAWLTARSVRTMAMRVRTQNRNAAQLAALLTQQPMVEAVYHPSLPSHPQYELAKSLFDDGLCGAIVSFCVRDDLAAVDEFFHALRLVRYLGTLGGIRTSVTHPATAFRDEFTESELLAMGLRPGLIRLSVGAEDVRDLAADLTQALTVFSEP